jgi:hypothetical protein
MTAFAKIMWAVKIEEGNIVPLDIYMTTSI